MKKWADYLISEVSYDSEHLISIATQHQDTDSGITRGKPVDRLKIASNMKNGFVYIIIYSGKNSWKPGTKLQTFSIGGSPYLRIDENEVKLDYLGDLPESFFAEKLSQELELQPEPITEPESPSSPRGLLPKESTEELPQDLELQYESEEEEFTSEQLLQVKKLEKEIKKLDTVNVEHEIIQILRKQNKKLDDIENKLHNSKNIKIKTPKSSS